MDMTEALRPSELFALRWRSFDDIDTMSITETIYKGEIRPYGKTDGSLTDVHLPPGLAEELRLWKQEAAKASPNGVVSPDAFIFPNSRGGFMDTGNYRNRVLNPLAEKLGLPKLNFQVMRRTMATQAQSMGSVKDIQAHLRHTKADTTASVDHFTVLVESAVTVPDISKVGCESSAKMSKFIRFLTSWTREGSAQDRSGRNA